MDSIKPEEIAKSLVNMGAYKSKLSIKDILIRGFLSGALLGISTVLAFTVAVQSQQYYLGALAFPVGFAIIVILGFELVTGNFATIPMAVLGKQANISSMLYNWFWAFSANLIGSIFFGILFFIYITKCGLHFDGEVINKVIAVAQDKTIAYKELGGTGILIVFTKAFLCNWMVTMGIVMGVVSSSTLGRIVALWLPIFTFFALGLEHCVVNMFVIPTAIMLHANISIADWWLWNQIPATLGNITGGFLMTGATIFFTLHKRDNH